MARSDLVALVDSGHRFYNEYGTWPTARSGDAGDIHFGKEIANAELVNVLRAVDGPGNENGGVNVHRIVFFESPARDRWHSGLDVDGEFIDPWGRPYQIVVDANLNNVCDIPNSIYNNMIGEGMIAWSCGPDQISDTGDDLLSWRVRRSVETEIIGR